LGGLFQLSLKESGDERIFGCNSCESYAFHIDFVPTGILCAEKQVNSAAFATDMDPAKRAFEIEKAKASILTNSDKEASAVIALSFANPNGRGNTSSFETVIAAGNEFFSKLPPDVTGPILDSLPHSSKSWQVIG
jgi:hypothetical protein